MITGQTTTEYWAPGKATDQQKAAIWQILSEKDKSFDPSFSERFGDGDKGPVTYFHMILNEHGYLTRVDNEPAAMLTFREHVDNPFPGSFEQPLHDRYKEPVVYVTTFACRDEFANNGLVSHLMGVLDDAMRLGGRHASGGRTWEGNEASKAVFQKAGYEVIEEVPDETRGSGVSLYFYRPEPPLAPAFDKASEPLDLAL